MESKNFRLSASKEAHVGHGTARGSWGTDLWLVFVGGPKTHGNPKAFLVEKKSGEKIPMGIYQ